MYITLSAYVHAVFSNIIFSSIPLAESKNYKPKISNAPDNFVAHILEVIWMTSVKNKTLKNLKSRFCKIVCLGKQNWLDSAW